MDIPDLVSQIELTTLRVSRPKELVVVCGGLADAGAEVPTSLRGALMRAEKLHDTYLLVVPEQYNILSPDSAYKDWLSFEEHLAHVCTSIILFSETPGSIAELGAFCSIKPIAEKLIVGIDTQYYEKQSFVRLGPIQRLLNDHGKHSVICLTESELEIGSWTHFPSQAQKTLEALFIEAIENKTRDNRVRTTFDKSNPGHIMLLIIGLSQHYGALTAAEIEDKLLQMNLCAGLYPELVKQLIFCGLEIGWLKYVRQGTDIYYGTTTSHAILQFRTKNRLAFSDKAEWRVQLRNDMAKHDRKRFAAVQQILKKNNVV